MPIINKIIRPFIASLVCISLLCSCTQNYNASNYLSQSQTQVLQKQPVHSYPEQKIHVNDKYNAPEQLRVPFPPIPDEPEDSSKEMPQ
jgi:hypothetical protein